MNRFSRFQIMCECGAVTTKKYAREHDGKCKACFTGIEQSYHGPKCPQCGGPSTAYKKAHHYVCESCVEQNDPVGYMNEVRGIC